MTSRQKTRMIIALAVCLGAAATVFLATAAFRQNMLFFYTPSQFVGATPEGEFRLGGLVDKVLPKDGSLETQFVITDNTHSITVSYRGVLPDLFREGQGVVVRGEWMDDKSIVKAGEVLAKHDENYMPPPLRDLQPAAKQY